MGVVHRKPPNSDSTKLGNTPVLNPLPFYLLYVIKLMAGIAIACVKGQERKELLELWNSSYVNTLSNLIGTNTDK